MCLYLHQFPQKIKHCVLQTLLKTMVTYWQHFFKKSQDSFIVPQPGLELNQVLGLQASGNVSLLISDTVTG